MNSCTAHYNRFNTVCLWGKSAVVLTWYFNGDSYRTIMRKIKQKYDMRVKLRNLRKWFFDNVPTPILIAQELYRFQHYKLEWKARCSEKYRGLDKRK